MLVKYKGDGENEERLREMGADLDLEKIKVVQMDVDEQEDRILIDLYILHTGMKDYAQAATEKGSMLQFSIPVFFKMKKDREIDFALLKKALKDKMRSIARKRLKEEKAMG